MTQLQSLCNRVAFKRDISPNISFIYPPQRCLPTPTRTIYPSNLFHVRVKGPYKIQTYSVFECPLAPLNRVTEGRGWNLPLWNGTTLQDPRTSSAVINGVHLNRRDCIICRLQLQLNLVLLWRSRCRHDAVCHFYLMEMLAIHSRLHAIDQAIRLERTASLPSHQRCQSALVLEEWYQVCTRHHMPSNKGMQHWNTSCRTQISNNIVALLASRLISYWGISKLLMIVYACYKEKDHIMSYEAPTLGPTPPSQQLPRHAHLLSI